MDKCIKSRDSDLKLYSQPLKGLKNTNRLSDTESQNTIQTNVPIKNVARGGLLGFEDTFGGRNYSLSARCVSQKGIVFKIDTKIFKTVLTNNHEIKNGLQKMST